MKVSFAFLCDYASVSREGKLSILGIFTRIWTDKVPMRHPQMYLAFQIELNYAEVERPFELEIQFVDADGNKIFTARAHAQFKAAHQPRPGERPQINQVLGIQDAVFSRIGTHNVNIFISGDLKKQIEFDVAERKPAEPTPPVTRESD